MRETHPKDNVIPKNSKTAQGKLNQASDCGGFGVSLHTSGSVTVPKHKAKMSKSLKRPSTPLELFECTHKHKDHEWVDKRSKHIDVSLSFSLIHLSLYWLFHGIEEAIQTASKEGSNAPNEVDVWCDTTGIKKRRIYELGIESTVIDKMPSCHSSSSQSSKWLLFIPWPNAKAQDPSKKARPKGLSLTSSPNQPLPSRYSLRLALKKSGSRVSRQISTHLHE
ncbi:hypothetical protein Ahy_B06g084972 [Arachis hypogaea]|uniref:Uncharacterized protein n=1 Tax=Arachis hypogaea TaxID=3818 RepID=A0A444YT85_ARAHY|nr:hypothetical protein Ahy_B06g084972 [Arachis hypogaea]